MKKRILSILLTISMLVTLLPTTIFAAENIAFKDMSGSEYYAESATVLSKLDILAGYEDGTFGAERTITRAEMAAIICRIIEKEADADSKKGTTAFDDVAANHWASGYINIASEEKIINGDGNGKFRPEDSVKYEEAAKMVVCAMGFGNEIIANPTDWSAPYLAKATEKGLVNNLKGSKGQAATRADIAVMVHNGLKAEISAPVVSLKGGEYRGTQKVKLTIATKDATIYYTTDGSTPNAKSTKYTKEISISKTCTLKAVATIDSIVFSNVTITDYTIKVASSGGGGGGGGSSSSSNSDSKLAEKDLAALVIQYAEGDSQSSVKNNIVLPTNATNGSIITWSSEDENVISSTGAVTRPTAYEEDAEITLIATAKKGSATKTKTFTLTVVKEISRVNTINIRDVEYNTTWVEPGKDLELVAYADPINQGDILTYNWSADKGSFSGEGTNVTYIAPEEYGTVVIRLFVSDNNGNVSENYDIPLSIQDPPVDTTDLRDSLNLDEDQDEDGLNNATENELGTNPFQKDSDNDGLDDKKETEIGTDPTNRDTDNDSIIDGVEISSGLNPLVADDTNTVYTYSKTSEDNDCTIEITGKSGAGNSDIFYKENNALYANINIYSKLYKASYTNGVDSVKVIIKCDVDKLSRNGKTIADLAVFKHNLSSGEIVAISTEIFDDAKVCATITSPSSSDEEQYFVADKNLDISQISMSSTVVGIDISSDMNSFVYCNEGFLEDLSVVSDLCGENSEVGIIGGFGGELQTISDLTTESINISDSINQIQFTNEDNVNPVSILNASADMVEDYFFKNIILVLSEFSEDASFVSKLNDLRNSGHNVLLVYTCQVEEDSDIADTGIQIISVLNSEQLYVPISKLDNELGQFEESNISLMAWGDQWEDTPFNPKKHGYNFANNDSAYNKPGGVCAGMALTSILNFYGMLPSGMVANQDFVNEWDAKAIIRDAQGNYVRDANGNIQYRYDRIPFYSVLYDVTDKKNIKGFINKQTKEFSGKKLNDNSSEIGKMLTSWWNIANEMKSNSDYGGEINYGRFFYIPNAVVQRITTLIDNDYPVYIGSGRGLVNLANSYSGHAVVVIGYSRNGNTLKLKLYDNNYPNDSRKNDFILTRDANSGFWSSNWSNYSWAGDSSVGTRTQNGVSYEAQYNLSYIDTEQLIKNIYKNKATAITTKWNGNDFVVNYPTSVGAHQLKVLKDGDSNAQVVSGKTISNVKNTEFYYSVRTYMNGLLPSIYNGVNFVKNNHLQLTDIVPDAWYEKSVKKIVDKGIMSGYPDGTFKPGQTMTTAEFVVTLCNAIGQQKTIPSSGHWAENYMKYARDNGWVYSGYTADTGYYDRKLARGEAIQLLWNIMSSGEAKSYSKIKYMPPNSAIGLWFDENRGPKGEVIFQDGNLSTGEYSYAQAALKQLYLNGVFAGVEINGYAYVNAWEHLNRASAAEFINKCLK